MLSVVNSPAEKKSARKIIKVAITKVGKDAIEAVADEYGMKEQTVAGRIYEWFFAQDDIVQRAILGMMKGMEIDAARRFMERFGEAALPPGVEKVVTTPRGAKAKTPAREPEPDDSQKRR